MEGEHAGSPLNAIKGNHKGFPLHKIMICRGNPLWLPQLKSLT